MVGLFLLFFSQIKLFLDVLMKEILSPESQSPDGVRAHLIDAYLDELSMVGGREVRSSTAIQQCGGTTMFGRVVIGSVRSAISVTSPGVYCVPDS